MKFIKPGRCPTPKFSPEDVDLAKFSWRVNRTGYPCRIFGDRKWRCAHVIVIERVLGRPRLPGEITDHINHDKMDARRENLRITDRMGNAQNMTSSKWRGTALDKQTGKWSAKVGFKRKYIFLGLFERREDAAKVAALKREQLNFLTSKP